MVNGIAEVSTRVGTTPNARQSLQDPDANKWPTADVSCRRRRICRAVACTHWQRAHLRLCSARGRTVIAVARRAYRSDLLSTGLRPRASRYSTAVCGTAVTDPSASMQLPFVRASSRAAVSPRNVLGLPLAQPLPRGALHAGFHCGYFRRETRLAMRRRRHCVAKVPMIAYQCGEFTQRSAARACAAFTGVSLNSRYGR
jgi:hypothetical protein